MAHVIPFPVTDRPPCASCGTPILHPFPHLNCRVQLSSGCEPMVCGELCARRLLRADAEQGAA